MMKVQKSHPPWQSESPGACDKRFHQMEWAFQMESMHLGANTTFEMETPCSYSVPANRVSFQYARLLGNRTVSCGTYCTARSHIPATIRALVPAADDSKTL